MKPISTLALALASTGAWSQEAVQPVIFETLYAEHCSVCHGDMLEGAAQGTPLVGMALQHGDSLDELAHSIGSGIPQTTMPAWSNTLDDNQIRQLAILIAERRAQMVYGDFKVAEPPVIPEGVIASEQHVFRIETVATGIDPLPYSIAPMPDGSILLTEKTRGLRSVSPGGELSGLIEDAPTGHDDGFEVPGILLTYGSGWIMDVAPHPDYANNGWIYLHYSERCSDCNEQSRQFNLPVSMNKLIRGRIVEGKWTDEQVIWSADVDTYTVMVDMAAGGRIAFDDAGHVYFSVGMKGLGEHIGMQDLTLPYGKIHRVNDDGTIPVNNPFLSTPGALSSIWTYGHRSPQGLEYDVVSGQLWGTEMGQRGGDEINLLQPGGNYGWPLHSLGLQYDGTPVAFGEMLGIEFKLEDIVQPVVDLTPAPAVSSFVVYHGERFPRWDGNLIVGTLKATELYRMVVEDGRVVHRELLLSGIGRIRDVETGPDGLLYVLLENAAGSRIVRLVPEGA